MKVRIQDNSVRFRITLAELDELNAAGRIEVRTESYDVDTGELDGQLLYGVSADEKTARSHCSLIPSCIWLELSLTDLASLNDATKEGVYLRNEVRTSDGEVRRFMAFIEKDRPASRCDKPEVWIYQYRLGQTPLTRPIGRDAGRCVETEAEGGVTRLGTQRRYG